MKNISRRNISGFTLIELLVVVLIIGILSAIAVPMYEKSTRKAHFVQVQTTLNTLMRDIDVYTMENGYDTADIQNLSDSMNCNSYNYNWDFHLCNRDEGSYWTNGGGGTIHLSFQPKSNLFVTSSGKDVYSFTKKMGEPWTWSNAGHSAWGQMVKEDNETLQLFCEWWIKMGGKAVSGAAKTLTDAHCK